MRYDGKEAFAGHGFQVHIGHNKPKSRGSVKAVSNDPKAHPQIRFNYLEHEEDREGFRACVRLTREIINQAGAATEQDWYEEYLGPILAIRVVKDVDAAISHINTYGSQHTDTIVTNDYAHSRKFMTEDQVMLFTDYMSEIRAADAEAQTILEPAIDETASTRNITSGYLRITSAISSSRFITPVEVSLCTTAMAS